VVTIKLSELLSPRPEPMWRLLKQSGVDHVVALLDGAEQDARMFAAVGGGGRQRPRPSQAPWSEDTIRAQQALFADHGFEVVVIEDTPPLDAVRLGAPGRDEQIDNVLQQVRAMGRLGIETLCYSWMAIYSWGRTHTDLVGRGGALVTGFRESDSDALGPAVEAGSVEHDQLWDALQYFLDAVVPVAEEVGVRLAMHPDDPPLTHVRNVPRIMTSPDAHRRLLAMHPSPSNAITFCQGNWTLMEDDLPTLIREFGPAGQIAFVHFRDVRGRRDDFVETFHDEGQTDLPECMRAYAEVGFSGPVRPDHVPTMDGEPNDQPAYGTLGRLFALGFIRGLEQAAYGKEDRAEGDPPSRTRLLG
jgi:mannonate dehydratase